MLIKEQHGMAGYMVALRLKPFGSEPNFLGQHRPLLWGRVADGGGGAAAHQKTFFVGVACK